MAEINRDVIDKIKKLEEIKEYIDSCKKNKICPLCGDKIEYLLPDTSVKLFSVSGCKKCDIAIEGFCSWSNNRMFVNEHSFLNDTYVSLSSLLKNGAKETA